LVDEAIRIEGEIQRLVVFVAVRLEIGGQILMLPAPQKSL